MIASAFVLVTNKSAHDNLQDLIEFDEDSEAAEDRDRHTGVAGWLLAVGIAGIIVQIIMVIFRGLYFIEVIRSQFFLFGIIVRDNTIMS